MEQLSGLQPTRCKVRPGWRNQRHGLAFNRSQSVRVLLGQSELLQLLRAKPCQLHSPYQRDTGFTLVARSLPQNVNSIPVDSTVIPWTRLATVPNIQNVEIVLPVSGFAGQHIGANHAGQVVRRLTQFVCKQVGLVALLVGGVNPLFRKDISSKNGDQGERKRGGKPQVGRKRGNLDRGFQWGHTKVGTAVWRVDPLCPATLTWAMAAP